MKYENQGMDRRQKKNRQAIYQALEILLEKKSYASITVQEIINEADIGRSTFYAHFETKDELLRTICTEIFDHVETTVSSSHQSLEGALAHLFWHLRETRPALKGILSSESASLFLQYFREYLIRFLPDYLASPQGQVPDAYILNHAVNGLAESVRWWLTENDSYTPEDMAAFWIQVMPGTLLKKDTK